LLAVVLVATIMHRDHLLVVDLVDLSQVVALVERNKLLLLLLVLLDQLTLEVVEEVQDMITLHLVEQVVLDLFLSHIQPKYLKKSYGTTSFARKYTIRI
tara:strand:+ start:464 stop:760 length:297 start_codon:yes stop_codon:yes gene_type:complete